MVRKNPLYLMVKPPMALAIFLAELFGTWGGRPPDLLHMTLLPLGDRATFAQDDLERLRAALGTIAAMPFRIVLDRVHGSGTTVCLRPSEPLAAAVAFQRALVARLARAGFRVEPRYDFRPHMTLAYRRGTYGEMPIDPVSWQVTEMCLIESIVGMRRHEDLGRWTLGV